MFISTLEVLVELAPVWVLADDDASELPQHVGGLMLLLLSVLFTVREPLMSPVVIEASPVFLLAWLPPVLALILIVLTTFASLFEEIVTWFDVSTEAVFSESAPVVSLVALSAKANGAVSNRAAIVEPIRELFTTRFFVCTTSL